MEFRTYFQGYNKENTIEKVKRHKEQLDGIALPLPRRQCNAIEYHEIKE